MGISMDGQWYYVNPEPSDCKLVDNNVADIIYEDGKVWLATMGGVSIFNLRSWQAFTGDRKEDVIVDGKLVKVDRPGNSGLLGKSIRQIFSTGDRVLFASDKGVSLFDIETQKWEAPLETTDFGNSGATCLSVDEKNIYVGLDRKGFLVVSRPQEPEEEEEPEKKSRKSNRRKRKKE